MQKLKTFTNNNIGIIIGLLCFYMFIDLQGFAIVKDALLQFKANFEAQYFEFPSWGD